MDASNLKPIENVFYFTPELALICVAVLFSLAAVVLTIIILIRMPKKSDGSELSGLSNNITASVNNTLRTLNEQQALTTRNSLSDVSERIDKVNRTTEERLTRMQESNEKKLSEIQGIVDEKLQNTLEQKVQKAFETVNLQLEGVGKRIGEMQAGNEKKLSEIQGVVDEKLQNALEQKVQKAFETINTQLESVNKSMGEMQSLATNVGDLKKVLTNVKTRGTFGEVQLEKILEQTLSGQYEKNVKTKKNSEAIVEFAVKIPSKDDDNTTIWLPIDSKFPTDRYNDLYDAYESGDKARAESASRAFVTFIKNSAKEIHDKYIDVPYTTNFAIMFVPTESIFAEVVKRSDLMDELMQKYSVTVTGPTTVIAFLNSLQMGFRTLAIQKYSAEIGRVLGATKAEFETFAAALEQVKKKYSGADEALDKLIGTRTNKIRSKLKNIEALPKEEAEQIFALESETDDDDLS